MMNLFRLAGDMCHVLSIVVLLLRLRVSKNAIGVSIKTQELYLIVFITRYLDLFTTYYSYYNSMMKILYISATAYIIYMVKGTEPFKSTFDKAHDSFLHYQFAVAPCVVLAVVTNLIKGFNVMEVNILHDFISASVGYILLTCSCIYYLPSDVMDILDISGGSSYRSSAHCVAEIPRS
jgi:ER lumen protein retaining receptor